MMTNNDELGKSGGPYGYVDKKMERRVNVVVGTILAIIVLGYATTTAYVWYHVSNTEIECTPKQVK